VGTGTSASCSAAKLNACLPGGGSFDGTVTFSCGGATTITVTSTKTISADTTIDGGSLVTISGGNRVGVFSVNRSVNFTVQNLTIANGSSDVRGFGGSGISNDGGTLTVTNSTFAGNSAGPKCSGGLCPEGGGGINNEGGTVMVTNSTFAGNSAGNASYGDSGGGISNEPSFFHAYGGRFYSDGTLTVTNSTFSSNSATVSGGGIDNEGGTLTVSNSTFSSNTAPGSFGGGIYNYNARGGALTVTNSTFFNNSAPNGIGGAIYTESSNDLQEITNSTFSGNSASIGGCIQSTGGLLALVVTNTILANNTPRNCSEAVYEDGGHNIEDGTTCGFGGSSLSSTNPLLDPAGLANNGGPTQTIALCTATGAPSAGCTSASPAINAGDEGVCSTTTGTAPVDDADQRRFVRPGTGATNCSIGAYEANGAACVANCSDGLGCTSASECTGGECDSSSNSCCGQTNDCNDGTSCTTSSQCASGSCAGGTCGAVGVPMTLPGQGKNGCMLEWFTEPATVLGRNGLPVRRLTCTDDDPTCDFGATTGDHACTFHVAVCLNVVDTRLSCVPPPTDVAQVQLLNPREAKPKDATATANRGALESALAGIGGTVDGLCTNRGPHKGQLCTINSDCDSTTGSGDGVCTGRVIGFAPPLATDNSCTAFAAIQVPLKQTSTGFKTGRVRLSVKAISDPSRRQKGHNPLTLICMPHP
jgi:predicted outer membrane repeat protein